MAARSDSIHLDGSHAVEPAIPPVCRTVSLQPPKAQGKEVLGPFNDHGRKLYKIKGTNFEVDERYNITSVVGHGAYGTVVAAIDTETNTEVAIKRVSRLFDDLIDGRRIWREVTLLRNLRDIPGVMTLQRLMKPREGIALFKDLYIVTELMNTDLHHVLRSRQALGPAHEKRFVYQLIRVLRHVHSVGIIHRDLKPANLLLNLACDMKLCDFGLARGGMPLDMQPVLMTDYVVTRWYRPPELLMMSPYAHPADMWGAGCIIAEILTRKPLFVGRHYIDQLQTICAAVPVTTAKFIATQEARQYLRHHIATPSRDVTPLKSLLGNADPLAVDLVQRLLAFDPDARLTAAAAMKHPYLADLYVESDNVDWHVPPEDWSFDNVTDPNERQLRVLLWKEFTYWDRHAHPTSPDIM